MNICLLLTIFSMRIIITIRDYKSEPRSYSFFSLLYYDVSCVQCHVLILLLLSALIKQGLKLLESNCVWHT